MARLRSEEAHASQGVSRFLVKKKKKKMMKQIFKYQ
jgi:hypothetical protein